MAACTPHRACTSVTLTHIYTLRSKSFSGLPYVGFPGLTLSPIPENPLLDSEQQQQEEQEEEEKEEEKDQGRAGKGERADDSLLDDDDGHDDDGDDDEARRRDGWNPRAMKQGSLPDHWVASARPTPAPTPEADPESAGCLANNDSGPPSLTCSVDMSSKHSFQSRDDVALTAGGGEQQGEGGRSHVVKLALISLCGLVVVIVILIWVFSPTFL